MITPQDTRAESTFFLLLTPPTGSRMTVIDVSNFRELQARGRGDQPAYCNNYIVLNCCCYCSHVCMKNTKTSPLLAQKRTRTSKRVTKDPRKEAPQNGPCGLVYTCRSRPIHSFLTL